MILKSFKDYCEKLIPPHESLRILIENTLLREIDHENAVEFLKAKLIKNYVSTESPYMCILKTFTELAHIYSELSEKTVEMSGRAIHAVAFFIMNYIFGKLNIENHEEFENFTKDVAKLMYKYFLKNCQNCIYRPDILDEKQA